MSTPQAQAGRSNLHCHSRYSDGKDSLEEMVRAAIDRGFYSLGFSEHAFAPYDSDCCMKATDRPRYLAEVAALRETYAGQIELYAGLEVDCFEPSDKTGLDFTIGSVHYVRDEGTGEFFTIDYRPEVFKRARDQVAGGDIRALVRRYFEQVCAFAEDYRPDIVGHLDLIVKLNRDGRYFDEGSDWYRALTAEIAERIAASGCIVELNSGGISRGHRSEPYPSRAFLERLFALGAPVMLASDAHTCTNLDFHFAEMQALLRSVGYRSVKQLRGGAFVDVPL